MSLIDQEFTVANGVIYVPQDDRVYPITHRFNYSDHSQPLNAEDLYVNEGVKSTMKSVVYHPSLFNVSEDATTLVTLHKPYGPLKNQWPLDIGFSLSYDFPKSMKVGDVLRISGLFDIHLDMNYGLTDAVRLIPNDEDFQSSLLITGISTLVDGTLFGYPMTGDRPYSPFAHLFKRVIFRAVGTVFRDVAQKAQFYFDFKFKVDAPFPSETSICFRPRISGSISWKGTRAGDGRPITDKAEVR